MVTFFFFALDQCWQRQLVNQFHFNLVTGNVDIVQILSKLQEVQTMISDYERLVTDLLAWIANNTKELSDHRFPNSLQEIKQEITNFKLFRTEQKPPKWVYWSIQNVKVLMQLLMQLSQWCFGPWGIGGRGGDVFGKTGWCVDMNMEGTNLL